jgi:hypothetical protein
VTDADTAAASDAAFTTSLCPGCGAVLADVPGLTSSRPGASPSCAGLFEVTVRGLRDEAGPDLRTAALLQLATDAYDAQHLPAGAPGTRPARWTTTVADVAADLDVVDLPSLVRSWADAVRADWAAVDPQLRLPADPVPTGLERAT